MTILSHRVIFEFRQVACHNAQDYWHKAQFWLVSDPKMMESGTFREFGSYIGSGAWLTNHQWGEYEVDGKTCKWTYFVKIVAAPGDAYVEDGTWYAADGTEIGPVIWGDFAIIQEVENDPCAGIHGLQYLSPDHAGFGGW